jgi:signal peptidase II
LKSSRARYVILGLVSISTIVLDQATKLQIMQTMRLYESIPIIPDFFSLTYIRNPGAAFGLLASSSAWFRMVFFGLASLFALILLGTIFFRLRHDDRIGQFSVAAILGGAIGNLLDRLRYGEVVDFLDVYIGAYHWPAFNVADTAISVGVFFLFIHYLLERKRIETAAANELSSG